ncbi:hypothetical protein SPRG_20262, partial [Saprolegnia parasitica CBS 223.65]
AVNALLVCLGGIFAPKWPTLICAKPTTRWSRTGLIWGFSSTTTIPNRPSTTTSSTSSPTSTATAACLCTW